MKELKARKLKNRIHYYCLALLFFIALFGRLGVQPLAHEEPRRALIALELLYGENGTQATLHGENYYRKPPLYNWVISSFYQITGSTNEWVSRLPSVLSFLSIAAFMFWFGARYQRRGLALFATVIFLASEDLLLYYSRMAEMDLFYSALTLPVILLPWHYLNTNRTTLFFTIPPLLASLGFLAKGFPSAPFLGISMLCAIVLNKRYKLFWSPLVLLSIALFILPTLVYFYPQYTAGTLSDSLSVLFGESANRAGGTKILDRLLHLVVFPLDTLKGMLPFSLLVLWVYRTKTQNSFLRAVLVLFMANYAIYLIAPGARLRYVYMLFPLLAYLFANASLQLSDIWIKRFGTIANVLLLLSLLFPISLMFYFHNFDVLLLVVSLAIITLYLLRAQKHISIVSLIAVMCVVRVGVDFVSSQPEVLLNDKAYMEKEDALNLLAAYPSENIYLNSRSEQYYTFSYEFTRMSQRILRHNEALDDKNGIYIVRRSSKPKELRLLSDFKIGKDTSFILAAWP